MAAGVMTAWVMVYYILAWPFGPVRWPGYLSPYYLCVLWYYDSIFDTQNDGNRNFTEKFISMASVFHQKLIKDSNSAHIFKLDCLFRYFLIFPHSEIPSGALLFVFSISEISSFLDFLSAIMMPL